MELVDSAAEISPGSNGVLYAASAALEGWEGGVTVGVGRAPGDKCGRCWNYSESVGASQEHPALCERCLPVIQDMGVPSPLAAAVAAAAPGAAAPAAAAAAAVGKPVAAATAAP